MAKYIQYDIENLEEIKITPTINQSDSNFSKSYISGSAIKGACISKYIIEKKIENLNDGISKELFLKGGLKFLNAYPLVNERSVPFPICYYAIKEDIKKSQYPLSITCSSRMNPNENYQKVKGKEFILFNSSESLKNINVEKTEYLHIRKPDKNNEDNKLFRYEVIKANEKFRGYIKIESEYEENIHEIKELINNSYFYIGGAKGTGYGLCKITNVKILNENPEYKYFETIIFKDEEYYDDVEKIYIYALSDIIYRNKLGKYKTIFDNEFIAQKLGVEEVTVSDECYIDTEYCTSFNNKWGYRQAVISGIKAGSIISYDIKSGEIDFDRIVKFMDEGIGERKNDGYGRFIILTSLDGKWLVNDKEEKENIAVMPLSKEKNKQLNLILNRIYNSKIESNIPSKVLDLKSKLTGTKNINKNQWGKLFRLMNILLETDKKAGIQRIDEYFGHINSKQRNRDLANALNRITIEVGGEKDSLKDFIKKYLNMSIEEFKATNEYEIAIGDVHSNLNEEEIYKYNVRILKELFRLNCKKGDN